MAAAWLKDAVFYEIYPQSFYDTNGDGIGDINGIIEKLGYIKDLGCNALWINPCFDSPFRDAGYDVRDYKKVAPRYGTNEDLVRLFHTAHDMGIRVLLDLVPGHTSEEHAWFRMSQKAERNEYSDRFIWTDFCFDAAAGFPYIGGESERSGTYVLNFFKCQPALNYGFFKVDQPWQLPANHPAAIATREAIKDIMRFWLEKGCDGFRVDMASSLVKNDDEKKTGTSRIWRDVRRMLDLEFPDAAMVSEWSNPPLALRAGYDCDFCLNVQGGGYSTLMRDYGNHKGEDHSYFKKDAGGSIGRFLDEYLDWYEDTKDKGYISMLTCNHDTIRPRYNLDEQELKLAYAVIFTMPGVPFLYYGDEIGMRYLDLPTKEGGYYRTGSRSPMQWDGSKNLGFSTGKERRPVPAGRRERRRADSRRRRGGPGLPSSHREGNPRPSPQQGGPAGGRALQGHLQRGRKALRLPARIDGRRRQPGRHRRRSQRGPRRREPHLHDRDRGLCGRQADSRGTILRRAWLIKM